MERVASIIVCLAASLIASGSAAEVVAVVSAQSPLTTLSKDQTVDIFLGKSSRFPDGTPAVPIDQVEGSATRDEFYLKFAGKSPAQVKAHWSKIIFTGRGRPPLDVANGSEVKKRIAENPNAIGYITPELVDKSVKVLPVN